MQGIAGNIDAGTVRRAIERVDDVPAVEAAAREAPLAIDLLVVVPVLDLAKLPFAEVWAFELVMAIDDPACVVGVVEVDDMIAHEMHRDAWLAHRVGEPRLERLPPALLAPDPDIGYEEILQRVQVA